MRTSTLMFSCNTFFTILVCGLSVLTILFFTQVSAMSQLVLCMSNLTSYIALFFIWRQAFRFKVLEKNLLLMGTSLGK